MDLLQGSFFQRVSLPYAQAWLDGDIEQVRFLEPLVEPDVIAELLPKKRIKEFMAYPMLRDGLRFVDVRDALGCAINSVSNYSQRLVGRGLISPRRQGPVIPLDKQDLYLHIGIKAENMTLNQLSDNFNLSYDQIRRALRMVGVQAVNASKTGRNEPLNLRELTDKEQGQFDALVEEQGIYYALAWRCQSCLNGGRSYSEEMLAELIKARLEGNTVYTSIKQAGLAIEPKQIASKTTAVDRVLRKALQGFI